MSRQTAKGTSFESQVADYLSTVLDAEIVRRARKGAKDCGDLHGVHTRDGERVVVECKNHQKLALSGWVDEAEVERGNDDAAVGVVVHKRRGRGSRRMGDTYVTMTLADFAYLLDPHGSGHDGRWE